jgi:hypothetical protein
MPPTPQPPLPPKKSKKKLLLVLVAVLSVLWVGAGLTTLYLLGKSAEEAPRTSLTEAPKTDEAYVSTDKYLQDLEKATSVAEAKTTINEFLQNYGASFDTTQKGSTVHQVIESDPLTDSQTAELKQGGRVLIEELSKYPKSWIKAAEVDKVLIINNLGMTAPDGKKANAAGVASTGYGIFMLDIGVLAAPNTAEYNFEEFARLSVHHELFHMSEWGLHIDDDPAWAALNDTKFVYNDASNGAQAPPDYYDMAESPGFVSGYARQNSSEDKAETFMFMTAPGKYGPLKGRLANDKVLAGKVAYLKKVALSVSADMNDAFFDKLSAEKGTSNREIQGTNYNELKKYLEGSQSGTPQLRF